MIILPPAMNFKSELSPLCTGIEHLMWSPFPPSTFKAFIKDTVVVVNTSVDHCITQTVWWFVFRSRSSGDSWNMSTHLLRTGLHPLSPVTHPWTEGSRMALFFSFLESPHRFYCFFKVILTFRGTGHYEQLMFLIAGLNSTRLWILYCTSCSLILNNRDYCFESYKAF